jgi:glycosyltransferase involved in cell wall biosynthesis
VAVRKGKAVELQSISNRVISLPLRVVSEEAPLRLGSIISVIAFMVMATFVGTIIVFKRRLDTIVAVYAFPQALAAVIVGKLTRRKVIVLTDGGDIDIIMKNPFVRPIILACLRTAAAVTAVNTSKRDALLSLVVKTEICPIIGVDISQFKYVPFGSKEKSTVLYVGRLSGEKCPDVLLNACGVLHRNGVRFRLCVVGDGPLVEEIEKSSVRLGLTDVVTMERYVAHSRVHGFFERSAIFVLPSRREGVSVALLEAMSAGCLCIVSDIPDNRDLIQHMDNGLVFRVNDEEDLAKKISWALSKSPSALAPMTAKAREVVERDYSSKAVGSDLNLIISGL